MKDKAKHDEKVDKVDEAPVEAPAEAPAEAPPAVVEVEILPKTLEHFRGAIGGLFIRPFTFPAGQGVKGHYHFIDHASFVVSGKVRVDIQSDPDGPLEKSLIVHAPNFIHVPAGKLHSVTAVDGEATWACVFSEEEALRYLDTPEGREQFKKVKPMKMEMRAKLQKARKSKLDGVQIYGAARRVKVSR